VRVLFHSTIMPELVRPDSLDWAKVHLEKFGDSDLLPTPFEYHAIFANWKSVKRHLEMTDLERLPPRGLVHFQVPKPEGTFRVATRLNPLDTILYTAAVYECAPLIEKWRVSPKIACSYRIDLQPDGSFFSRDTPFDSFNKLSIAHAARKSVQYVVNADIADFYTQIGIHRVKNALEGAGVPEGRAEALHDVLLRWNAKQSRGIPVGPHASIVLAEAVLNDVDQFLVGRGFKHVRYVDDFRIFCKSYAETIRALHDLSEYLSTAHRLALQPTKTRTLRKETFLKWMEDPERLAKKKKKQKLADATLRWTVAAYDDPGAKRPPTPSDADILPDLLTEALGRKPVRIGELRFVLKQATRVRTNKIQNAILKNLRLLVPVLGEVVAYLCGSKQKSSSKAVAKALRLFALEAHNAYLPFVREWIIVAMEKFGPHVQTSDLVKLASTMKKHGGGLREEALLARIRNDQAWTRQHKERWKSMGEWDRRAVILAGSTMTPDERHAWKDVVQGSDDLLDRCVANEIP
jgi:hypothetical protein